MFAALFENTTIMTGITIEKSTSGTPRYMRIDLRRFGNNPLIEDFIDNQIIEMRKDEEVIPWEDVKKKLDKKHGIK